MTNQSIDPELRLRDCREPSLNVHVALPLHGRLDALIELLDDTLGVRTSRREVVGALILAAPEDPEELERLIRTHRLATASDAVVRGVDGRKVLAFRSPGPGRRRRSRAAE